VTRLILVTNDDGLTSPGLLAAAQAAAPLGDLLVVAPLQQQSAMSRAFPKNPNNGRVEFADLVVGEKTIRAYGVEGSPAIAVSHGILEFAERTPDLCISGINYGENIGLTLNCSGTIGAAYEAFSYGIPSLAVSLEANIAAQHSSAFEAMDWTAAQHFTQLLARQILAEGLAPDVAMLNLNVPSGATAHTHMRLTTQSKQSYFVFVRPDRKSLREPCRLETMVEVDDRTLEADSDITAVTRDRVVSVTPLAWSMTAPSGWRLPR
jgi:5'-nucleotidase